MGSASGIFLFGISTIALFNVFYAISNPMVANLLIWGLITAFIIGGVVGVAFAGIQVFGSGFTGESVRIVFGVVMLLTMFFKIDLPSMTNFAGTYFSGTLGLGLITNLFDAFPITILGGFPYYMVTVFSIITVISGLVVIIGGSG